VGYLHLVNDDQETLKLVTWNREAQKGCQAAFDDHYPISAAGIWADSFRQRQVVIHNDYPAQASAAGLPEGHFPLQRHMSAPVVDGNLVRMIIGVGNKEEPYHQADAQQLQMVSDSIQTIIMRHRAEQKLIESNRRLKLATDSAEMGVWELDLVADQLIWDEQMFRLYGLDGGEECGGYGEWLQRIEEEDRAEVRHQFDALSTQKLSVELEFRILRRQDGERRTLKSHALVQCSAEGVPQKLVGVSYDISNRKKREKKLQLAANVFHFAHEGIVITDFDAVILDVNETFTTITGFTREEAIQANPRILKSERHDSHFYRQMWRSLLNHGQWCGEIWNRRKDGQVYPANLTISAIRDDKGGTSHYVALFTDISAQKEAQQRLEQIAHFDALTGLPNRTLLGDRLRQDMIHASRRQQRLTLAFIDLDGFKAVNDNYDHSVGDLLLQTVAKRMQQALREGDTLARLGGDEFVAVLVDLKQNQEGVVMYQRLLAAASQPLEISGAVIQVSASLGVTFYPQREEIDADQLLRQADQAMYQAKQKGKNCYQIFDADLESRFRFTQGTIERLVAAVRDGEMELYYQPKIHLRRGEVVGAEALIRWNHPTRGVLPPAEFLPIIDNHPLIATIGEWVLEVALQQLQQWQRAGVNLLLSINVAAYQLQQKGFVPHLEAALARYPEVSPRTLVLEILETTALDDVSHSSEVVLACRELGVGVSLDDFGTGYSSLAYLRQLPVTEIKIDQSFVRDMLHDPADFSIVNGVLGMSEAFQIEVVAEGVETEEQGVLLIQAGCRYAQGYAIARPLPLAGFEAWMRSWRPVTAWCQSERIRGEGQPLLFAGICHRSWVRQLQRYLSASRDTPPPMNIRFCRFGRWLEEYRQQFRESQQLHEVELCHNRIHEVAAELIAHHQQGEPSAPNQIREVTALSERLLGLLQQLYTQDP
ncbi:MAG: EAL domain-containing protein, partial [Gammaproteobacteria bacterium]|nr:EAL domain-containing protein [Gammaproteobacteria bacterium]